MHARVVRFTDVSPERISEILSRVDEQGPPSDTDPDGFELFFDEEQRTAVFVGYFETEQKLRDADSAFEEMDASETPGNRASVDRCEIKMQRRFNS